MVQPQKIFHVSRPLKSQTCLVPKYPLQSNKNHVEPRINNSENKPLGCHAVPGTISSQLAFLKHPRRGCNVYPFPRIVSRKAARKQRVERRRRKGDKGARSGPGEHRSVARLASLVYVGAWPPCVPHRKTLRRGALTTCQRSVQV